MALVEFIGRALGWVFGETDDRVQLSLSELGGSEHSLRTGPRQSGDVRAGNVIKFHRIRRPEKRHSGAGGWGRLTLAARGSRRLVRVQGSLARRPYLRKFNQTGAEAKCRVPGGAGEGR